MELVDGASCGLRRIRAGDDDIKAFCARRSLRQPDRRELAADQLSLDDGERQPAVAKAHGDRLPRDTTTATHDIEFLWQFRTPATMRSTRRYEECSSNTQSSIGRWYWFVTRDVLRRRIDTYV